MAVRLSHEEILAARAALDRLARIPLDAAAAARVARMVREVERVAGVVARRRNELVERFAERDLDGQLVPATDERLRERGMIRIDPARRSEFERALAALLAESVHLDLAPLGVMDLRRDRGETVEIPPALLVDLGPLFDDRNDEES